MASLTTVDALAQFAFLIHGTLERRAAERDVSMSLTRLLGVLRDRQPTMNELAALLGLDKSSVTGLIDRAERRGFVVRESSTSDRRAVLVVLTVAGRDVVTEVADEFAADVTALLRPLGAPDRRRLTQLASQVVVARAAAAAARRSSG